jgi:hypothetical protein
MKHKRVLLLVAAILLIAFFFAIRSRVNPQPVPNAPTSPTPEVLGNGWYRFTDKAAGYSVCYPPDAYLDAQNEAGLEFRQARIRFPKSVGEANQAMLISVFSNQDGTSLPEIIQQKVYQGKLPKNSNGIHLTPVRIAGLDASKMEMAPFFPAISISAKGRVYFISLPANMLWGNRPTQASVDLYYKIINTFSLN